MTIVLEKKDWDGSFESSVVLSQAAGVPVILVGEHDRELVTFEINHTAGAPFLSTRTPLDQLVVSSPILA